MTTNPTDTAPLRRRWRVGSHYGIHVYEITSGEPGTENDDRPVATFHTVRDAHDAVTAFNWWIETHARRVDTLGQ